MFAMNDRYSDYFTLLLGKTTIQATKIGLFLSMYTLHQKFLLQLVEILSW